MRDSKIFVYGAGNMGIAVVDMLESEGKDVAAILDRNPSLKGKRILGVPVQTIDELLEDDKKEAVFLVSLTAVPYGAMEQELHSFGCKKIFPAGDYLKVVFGIDIVNVWSFDEKDNEEKFFASAERLLSDDESKKYLRMAWGWFRYRNEGIENVTLDRNKYFPSFLLPVLRKEDSMLDVSLLDGSYVRQYAEVNPGYSNIWGFSLVPSSIPDVDVLRLEREIRNLKIYPCEAGDFDGEEEKEKVGIMMPFTRRRNYKYKVGKIDTRVDLKNIGFIRGYSMKPILPIIGAAESLIRRDRPIIALNVSHYKNDFISWVTFLPDICEHYKYVFRMHSFQGNDCILYAIPEERYIELSL